MLFRIFLPKRKFCTVILCTIILIRFEMLFSQKLTIQTMRFEGLKEEERQFLDQCIRAVFF